MMRVGAFGVVVLLASTSLALAAERGGAPAPHVVGSSPVAAAREVDPGLKEVSVTFSEPMQDGSWSWGQESVATFPRMAGQPRYSSDGLTCSLPVNLEPDREYVVWINTARLRNFRSRRGVPAEPYRIAFRTRR